MEHLTLDETTSISTYDYSIDDPQQRTRQTTVSELLSCFQPEHVRRTALKFLDIENRTRIQFCPPQIKLQDIVTKLEDQKQPDKGKTGSEWNAQPGKAGAYGETFAIMIAFVMEYSQNRITFCNSCLNNAFIARIVDAAYQIAKMQSVPLKNFPLAIKDLDDYGDYSPFVAEGLRCEHCYGQLYFNQVNPKTGIQFQWSEIAQALKRCPKSKSLLPTHLWERLASVEDEDMTKAEVYSDISLVDSFLEAARATGANEAAMVWQVVRHAGQEADTVKDLILSANWVGLATHNARVLLDAMWRGPIYLSKCQSK